MKNYIVFPICWIAAEKRQSNLSGMIRKILEMDRVSKLAPEARLKVLYVWLNAALKLTEGGDA